MITLQDAIGRAELMMEEEGILRQDSYNMLVKSLDEEDVYPFTVALAERGIGVRTGKVKSAEESNISSKLSKAAQRFVQKEDGGLFVPEEYAESEEEYPDFEAEEEIIPLGDEDIEEAWTLEEYDELEDIERLKEVLESVGVALDKDGKVIFYKSNIPGLYTEQGRMSPMDLETAFSFFDRSMSSVDKEQDRVNQLLDYISRLDSTVADMEFTLDEIEKFKYSPQSRSQEIQEIARGLEQIQSAVYDGDWNAVQSSADLLKNNLAQYSEDQRIKYEESLQIVEVLDKLMDLKESDPDKFNKVTESLGGAIAAGRKAQYAMPDEMPEGAEFVGKIEVEVGDGFIRNCVDMALEAIPPAGNTTSEVYMEFISEAIEGDRLSSMHFEDVIDAIMVEEEAYEAEVELTVVGGNDVNAYSIVYKKVEGDPSTGVPPHETEWDNVESFNQEKIKALVCEGIKGFVEAIIQQ